MRIANPIYDVVFKYMMEDNKIAKLMISSIIGQEVLEIDFLPQERTAKIEKKSSFTVYRLDFKAIVKTPEGKKTVIIELQKAKFYTDIMRFRRYLGNQYRIADNSYEVFENNKRRKIAYPIICIYFLGYPLEHAKAPVVKVLRKYYDSFTMNELKEKEPFIESLTHDSFIIQIPYLKEKRRDELEKLLSVFDQSNQDKTDHRLLNINEKDYPGKYREVIRRLMKASAEQEIMDTMEIEDEVLEELEQMERIIEEKDQTISEKDQAISEQNKIIEELRKQLREVN